MKQIIFVLSLAALTGCATQELGTTIPGETLHRSTATGTTEDEALTIAARTAENYCEKYGKRAATTDSKIDYIGPGPTEKNLESVAKIGAALYGHNTGNYYYFQEEPNFRATLIHTCTT